MCSLTVFFASIYSAGQKFCTFNAMDFLWPPWERGANFEHSGVWKNYKLSIPSKVYLSPPGRQEKNSHLNVRNIWPRMYSVGTIIDDGEGATVCSIRECPLTTAGRGSLNSTTLLWGDHQITGIHYVYDDYVFSWGDHKISPLLNGGIAKSCTLFIGGSLNWWGKFCLNF